MPLMSVVTFRIPFSRFARSAVLPLAVLLGSAAMAADGRVPVPCKAQFGRAMARELPVAAAPAPVSNWFSAMAVSGVVPVAAVR
ncbi:MAG: hypothetical protein HYV18_00505 [Gammaproteobacteria bacterium]|nr:hypothetical protein [Gammaproteobacteria bacterium]